MKIHVGLSSKQRKKTDEDVDSQSMEQDESDIDITYCGALT